MNAKYLGDSVYVCVEDGFIKLYLDNGTGPHTIILLEAFVMEAFIEWYKRLQGVTQL